ncbi:hypothetical protein GpartN1_g4090.t1 [Galdieria partita]|uniref:Thioredoxin domain-containing protein n=1 Tax=Galdieria partita TaxID=83374 RepID=A0A9C7PXD3_9RHOD|nr:hypothetical protein GpartN1_g4090.t1 [Galdieria partita]
MLRWTSWLLVIGSCLTILWGGKEHIGYMSKGVSNEEIRPLYCEQLHSIPGYQSVYADWDEWSKMVQKKNISSGPLIVLFYLPACFFSRNFWPKVEALARTFPTACVVTIRMGWETPRLESHMIYSFPTLFISKDGLHFHRYRGERDWNSLLNATQNILEKKAQQTTLYWPVTLPRELFSVEPHIQYMKHLFIFAIWLGAIIIKWPYWLSRIRLAPNNNPWDQYLL